MKRSRKIQLNVLKKLEVATDASLRFEQFAKNYGGYEDATTPDWSVEQAYNIRLMIRDGLVRLAKVDDAPWFGPAPDDPYAETYISLTSAGHDRLEASNWLIAAYRNVKSNMATVAAAVVLAVASQWALGFLELN